MIDVFLASQYANAAAAGAHFFIVHLCEGLPRRSPIGVPILAGGEFPSFCCGVPVLDNIWPYVLLAIDAAPVQNMTALSTLVVRKHTPRSLLRHNKQRADARSRTNKRGELRTRKQNKVFRETAAAHHKKP